MQIKIVNKMKLMCTHNNTQTDNIKIKPHLKFGLFENLTKLILNILFVHTLMRMTFEPA